MAGPTPDRAHLVALVLLAACDAPCDDPRVLDGRTYAVFGNLVDFEQTGAVAPPGSHPANGTTEWAFTWGNVDAGPVNVVIDGQELAGTGVWSRDACNTFTLELSGVFTSVEGVRHVFETTGDYRYWDTVLEGDITWSDRWTFGESSGVLEATDAALFGQAVLP